MPEFQPFVPPGEHPPEFTLRAILLGSFFGIIFGAVTVYVGLRAGLTERPRVAPTSLSLPRRLGYADCIRLDGVAPDLPAAGGRLVLVQEPAGTSAAELDGSQMPDPAQHARDPPPRPCKHILDIGERPRLVGR